MPSVFQLPRQVIFSSGEVQPNSFVYFTITGTTTPKPIYSDYSLSTQLANPIQADAVGRLPTIFLDTTTSRYRVRITDEDGNQLDQQDDIGDSVSAVQIGQALYPRTTAEINASVTPVNYLYPPGHVARYGAFPGNPGAVNRPAIQAALDLMVSQGVPIQFENAGVYAMDSTGITALRSDAGHAERFIIHGNGARLSWATSGITSGSLFRIGATSQTFLAENGFTHFVSPLALVGPETQVPAVGISPTTTVRGWSFEFAYNVTGRGCGVHLCYEGIRTNFCFQLELTRFIARNNYVSCYVDDDSTLALWHACQFIQTHYAVVIRPTTNTKTISNQVFKQPWIQDCLVAFSLDPHDGTQVGIDGFTLEQPYFESITYDYFRIGRAWTFANPGTRGADRNRDVLNSCIMPSGEWGAPDWDTATKAPLCLSTTGTVKGGEMWIAGALSEIVGSYANANVRSGYDKFVGDSSSFQTYLRGGLAIGGGAFIARYLSNTATWNPGSLNDGQNTSTTVTVTGASVGDPVFVGFTQVVPGGMQLYGIVTSADTVTVVLRNIDAGTTDLASGTVRASVWKH
jgi:hypothetical protein